MSKSLPRWLMIAVLFAVGMGIAGWYGPRLLHEAHSTADWPTVEGEVVACDVEEPAPGGQSWRLWVSYRYEFDGGIYRSNRWDVHGARRFDTQAEALAGAAEYRVGAAVSVHYDPNEPSQAVLEVGKTDKAWLTIALGAMVAMLAVRLAARRS